MSDQTYAFRAMNTQIDLHLSEAQARSSTEWDKLFADIRLLFAQVENTCSRFDPDSELSQLNQTSEQAVEVSPLLYAVLHDAREAFGQTNGMYNPGLLSHLEAAGYDKSLEQLTDSPEEPAFAAPLQAGVPFDLDPARKTVRLQRGCKIDLGGIAKGWTVDRAVNYLKQHGHGFLNAGGDLRIFGTHDEFLRVGVENPFVQGQDIGFLTIKEGAIATSSTWKRRWKKGNR